jgi:hypothetical protein
MSVVPAPRLDARRRREDENSEWHDRCLVSFGGSAFPQRSDRSLVVTCRRALHAMLEFPSKPYEAIRPRFASGLCFAAAVAILVLTRLRSAGIALLLLSVAAWVLAWTRAVRAAEQGEARKLLAARALLARGESTGAGRMASQVAAGARTRRVRNEALTTVAWAEVAKGHPERAKEALARIQPPHHIDLYCFAAVEDAIGKRVLAIQALELEGSLGCEGAKFLVELHARQGRFDRAVTAAMARREVLGVDNCRRIVESCFEAWALGPAATLASALFGDTGACEDAAALIRALAHKRDFGEVDRAVDDVLGRLGKQGRLSEARVMLSRLRVDRTLPSGVCRALEQKLRSNEVE